MENIRVLLGWVPVLLAPLHAREALEQTLRLLDVRYWFNEAERSLYIEPPLLSRRIRLVQGFPGTGPLVDALAQRLRSAGAEVWVGQVGMPSPPGPWHVTLAFAGTGQGPTQVRANWAARRNRLWHGVNQALAKMGIPTQARWMLGRFPSRALRPVLGQSMPTILIEATPPTWKELDPKSLARKLLRCIARTYAEPNLLRLIDGWALGESQPPPLVAASLGRPPRTPAATVARDGGGIASIMSAADSLPRAAPAITQPAPTPAVRSPEPAPPGPPTLPEPPPAAVRVPRAPEPEDMLELTVDELAPPEPPILAVTEPLPSPEPTVVEIVAASKETHPDVPLVTAEAELHPPPLSAKNPPTTPETPARAGGPVPTSRTQATSSPMAPPWWMAEWAGGRPFVPEQAPAANLSSHPPIPTPPTPDVQAATQAASPPPQPPVVSGAQDTPRSALQEARRWEATVIPVRSVSITRHVRVQARKTNGT